MFYFGPPPWEEDSRLGQLMTLVSAPGTRVRKTDGRDAAAVRFREIRKATEALAAPLSAEDQMVQSMPDASPTKWHRAHTTWFFETFLLRAFDPGWKPAHPEYRMLFNSYYEAVGPRYSRPARGVLSRPSTTEVGDYRRRVDAGIERWLQSADDAAWAGAANLLELGFHHEQQHQELILTDIKHALFQNPIRPAYDAGLPPPDSPPAPPLEWLDVAGGTVKIGHSGDEFAFDCEGPRHTVFQRPFRIAARPVTNGEYLAFLEDGGYQDVRHWLWAGKDASKERGWSAPLYWVRDGDDWHEYTLAGLRPIDENAPVCHVSYFEADAFARWAGKRLPTEVEWEMAASDLPLDGNLSDRGLLHPAGAAAAGGGLRQMFGDVWEWTMGPYVSYPGFVPAPGAVGEYNGKFMSGQMVLRGGSCATPPGHIRATYRNFFYPPDRWQFSGIRLASDS